ncbi:MAG: hypothetical protein KH452_06005 [Clostridiales bacterium]|nr:hypothetical protein [Clostridiales bacterium]
MDLAAQNKFFEYLHNFQIREIPEDTNFWMIRSKSGYFYDEFVQEEFIALGWNYIQKDTVIDSQTIETLKTGIKDRYGDKVPMTAINKCKRFITELKAGDYVVIPNSGSSKIAIGIVGEYYEIADLDYTKELIDIKKIENKECQITEIKCPYKKRRAIEVILQIPTNKVGYNVLRSLSSYHGLSCMNDYAIDILNCIYDCYGYKGDLIFNLNVGKEEPIRPREVAGLMYGVTSFFGGTFDEEDLSVSLNLNSPGKVTEKLKGGFNKLKRSAIPLAAIYIAVVGGSGLGFELPGVLGFIKQAKTLDIEVEKEKAELDSLQLENLEKVLKIIEEAENEGINVDEALNGLDTLQGLKETLYIQDNSTFAGVVSEEEDVVEE